MCSKTKGEESKTEIELSSPRSIQTGVMGQNIVEKKENKWQGHFNKEGEEAVSPLQT